MLKTIRMVFRFRWSVCIVLFAALLSGISYAGEGSAFYKEVVKVNHAAVPQFTLFLRLPAGVRNPADVRGVMAECVLAKKVDDIEQALLDDSQGKDDELSRPWQLDFADEHKLATIVWGSFSLWDAQRNYDELTKKKLQEYDQAFDAIADAWDRGVRQLSSKYKIPDKNFLLHGTCGAAQWSHRLALRKPDRFLAVHIHIGGSYDQPTQKAKKCLWLVTTGESEYGYPGAKRFYADCLRLGYPIIFKAAADLGRENNILNLGRHFFEYALSIQKEQTPDASAHGASDFPSLVKPPYVADYVNQEVYPLDKINMIPEKQRVSIPTRELAEAYGEVIE